MEERDQLTITGKVTVVNKRGLHLRLAGALVKLLSGYHSNVILSKDGNRVNARSMLDLVSLSAAPGSELDVMVDGYDAEAAFQAVKTFFAEYSSEA